MEMPAELAERLTGEGFDEVVSFRGYTADAHVMLTVAPAGLAAAANLVTILVSRDAFKDLIEGVRAWMIRRTGHESGSEFAIEISARRGNERSSVRVTAWRDVPGDIPQIDTSALVSLVESILPANGTGGDNGVLPPTP